MAASKRNLIRNAPMPLPRISSIAILASFLVTGAAFCQAPKDDLSWQRYTRVVRGSTLEYSDDEPFFLKLEYRLYDVDGKPVQRGTVEESWGDGNHAIHIQSASLDVKEPSEADDDIKTHTRENFLVHQVLRAVARPIPELMERANFVISNFQETPDSPSKNCFALVPPGTKTIYTPAYCTDQDNRLALLADSGSFTLRRSTFRKYRDREVPLDIELSYGDKIAITAHVTELDELEPKHGPSSAPPMSTGSNAPIPPNEMKALVLKKKEPEYPKEAQKKHIVGTVVLYALVNKTGTVEGLDVIASPDPLLTKSAIESAQKSTYKPYLLNGTPINIDTTIMVSYGFAFF